MEKEIWKKEFDERFCETHFCLPGLLYDMKFDDIDRIKGFIAHTLSQSRQAVIAEIKGMVEGLKEDTYHDNEKDAIYNQAIADVLSILEEL